MARAGVSSEAIVRCAITLIDAHGTSTLTLARVAEELGVSSPSLYKHVKGLEDLLDRVAADVTAELATHLGTAIRGKAGRDALIAIAYAYRSFALEHPGTYPLTQRHLKSDDWQSSATDAFDSFVAVLSGYGIEGDDIDAIRVVRSSLHGFADLERIGGFGLPTPTDNSFALLIDTLDTALRAMDRSGEASTVAGQRTSNHQSKD